MKNYNKPTIYDEIIELEDIIAASQESENHSPNEEEEAYEA